MLQGKGPLSLAPLNPVAAPPPPVLSTGSALPSAPQPSVTGVQPPPAAAVQQPSAQISVSAGVSTAQPIGAVVSVAGTAGLSPQLRRPVTLMMQVSVWDRHLLYGLN